MFNALKSLTRLKIMSFLIVIQLALGLALINNIIFQSVGVIDKKTDFANMFKPNNTYMVRVSQDLSGKYPTESLPRIDLSMLKKVGNEVYSLKNNSDIKDIYSCFNSPSIPSSLNQYKLQKYTKIADKFLQGRFIGSLIVDKNFINRNSYKISEGRGLENKDFDIDYKTNNIPIVLGEDYKKKIHIGNTFSEELAVSISPEGNEVVDKVTFEVVGFYEKNSVFSFLDKTNFFNSVTYSNSLVIIPADNITSHNSSIALYDVGLFIEVSDGTSQEELEKKINNVMKKLDPEDKYKLESRITYLKDDIANINEDLQNDINTKLLLGSVLIILSLIGITTTLLGELKERRRELGIRLASGATTKVLCTELIYEILILVCVSIIISNLFLKYVMTVYDISMILVFANMGILILFTILISILPILALKKNKIIELLREEK